MRWEHRGTQPATLRLLSNVIGVLGIALGGIAFAGVRHPYVAGMPLVLLLIPLLAAAVLVHESGHLIAAASAGLRVLGVSLGPLHIERRRHGVRLHWRARRRGVAGMAFAVPDFSKDVRRQMLAYVAGGPLANLLVAAPCLLAAWPISGHAFTAPQAAIFAFGLLNATMGLANLVPYRHTHFSDGLLLERWWRGGDAVGSGLKQLRSFDQSLRGVLASEMPLEQIAEMESDPAIGMRFSGSYLALRAAQQRGDQHAFAAIMARCERELAGADKATYAAMRPFWAYFQIEQSFENALSGDSFRHDIDPACLRALLPYFRDRLAAAEALARRDEREFRNALARSERDAEGAFDAATRRAEAQLRDRMRQTWGATGVAS